MAGTRTQRTYDPRLRELVLATGDVIAATRLGVPRSTAAGWLRSTRRPVVTLPGVPPAEADLYAEVARLRRRLRCLAAILRVLLALVRTFRLDLARRRVPEGKGKLRLLRAVERAREVLPLRRICRLARLSPSRYHAWRRAQEPCQLEDEASCPKLTPHRLTPEVVRRIREMVTSPDDRHVPTGTLARLAQRLGRVFASASTWHRLVRECGWRRPRVRVHPQRPKVGIRAAKPNEVWHVDTTVLRLLDGTKAYLHAVIDNFSRRILAWRLAERFEPANAVAVLHEAGRAAGHEGVPTVVADQGVENRNGAVDALVSSGLLRRVLAMTEIRFSNSMIEAWWRSLKHQWLFLHSLDTVPKLHALVAFYVAEHNSVLPHSAFRGQTPDEMYFGSGDEVPAQLEAARSAARRRRLEENRARACPACDAA
ncbi:MAG: transposase [Planctomycetaceae bacterium]